MKTNMQEALKSGLKWKDQRQRAALGQFSGTQTSSHPNRPAPVLTGLQSQHTPLFRAPSLSQAPMAYTEAFQSL